MIYLDNAATSRYKPYKVIKAITRETSHSANPGRSGHYAAISSAMKVENCRELLTNIFGKGDVVFTKNCTEALNLAIFGSKLDNQVVTTSFEHNSVLRPLNNLKEKGLISMKIVEPNSDGIITSDSLNEAFKEKTSALIINETSNVLGITQNIEELSYIAYKKGIKVIVDTAQSLGHKKTNYRFVDMIASSGHKGLHGPQGTGFLFIRKDVRLTPIIMGGTGTSTIILKQPDEMPEGFESGTLNTSGIYGLYEGAKWSLKNHIKINEKIKKLSELLIEGLKRIPGVTLYYPNNGVILFNIRNIPSMTVADLLNKDFDIGVRAGLHCAPLAHSWLGTLSQGGVRASIGYNNSVSHIEALIDGVKTISMDIKNR